MRGVNKLLLRQGAGEGDPRQARMFRAGERSQPIFLDGGFDFCLVFCVGRAIRATLAGGGERTGIGVPGGGAELS